MNSWLFNFLLLSWLLKDVGLTDGTLFLGLCRDAGT
jgi:hypothetical protein